MSAAAVKANAQAGPNSNSNSKKANKKKAANENGPKTNGNGTGASPLTTSASATGPIAASAAKTAVNGGKTNGEINKSKSSVEIKTKTPAAAAAAAAVVTNGQKAAPPAKPVASDPKVVVQVQSDVAKPSEPVVNATTTTTTTATATKASKKRNRKRNKNKQANQQASDPAAQSVQSNEEDEEDEKTAQTPPPPKVENKPAAKTNGTHIVQIKPPINNHQHAKAEPVVVSSSNSLPIAQPVSQQNKTSTIKDEFIKKNLAGQQRLQNLLIGQTNRLNGGGDEEEEEDIEIEEDEDLIIAAETDEVDEEEEEESTNISQFREISMRALQINHHLPAAVVHHPDEVYENEYYAGGEEADEDEENEEEFEDSEPHELYLNTALYYEQQAMFQKQLLLQQQQQFEKKAPAPVVGKRVESPEPGATYSTGGVGVNSKNFKMPKANNDDEEDEDDLDMGDGDDPTLMQARLANGGGQGAPGQANEFCSDNEEQEDVGDYCKGGYHPVKIGDLYNQRYHVLRKLGWGHFSTVWLCWDFKAVRFVALKIVKSAKHYTEAAADEIKLLQCARDGDPQDENRFRTVQLLDHFKVTGPNGVHVCMVFEVLGNNLLKLIIKSNYHGIPLQNVKIIVKQVLQGLDYLHRKCQIIHTDMKPENVLICVDETHVRHLAQEAAEWQKMGIKPSGSAVATVTTAANGEPVNQAASQELNNPDAKMSRNKRKKLRKKQKRIQTLLDTQQKQIELSEKENINLLGYDNDDNKPTLILDMEETVESEEVNGGTDGGVKRRMTNSSSIYNCDLTSVENKRLSKLMSIVQDVNIDKLVSGSGQSGQATTQKPGEATASNGGAAVNVTSDPEQTEANDGTKKKKNRRRQKKKKNNSNSKPGDGEEETPKPGAVNLALTEPAKDVEAPVKTEEAKETADGGQAAGITSVSQQVAELKRKHLNPVFEVVQDERNLQVKIADLGNACWTYHHFTEDIQTRQYRSLEVILGSGYNTSADIWSLACMAFELATGDYLFEPHSGENYTRDEDHIAHIIELLGPIPFDIAMSGKYSGEFFTKRGQLRHINQLRPWELYEVLTEKYEWSQRDAAEFADFLLPMLNYNIYERATALECLHHPWITGQYPDDYVFKNLSSFGASQLPASSLIMQNGNTLVSATIPPHPLMMNPVAAAAAGGPAFANMCYTMPGYGQVRGVPGATIPLLPGQMMHPAAHHLLEAGDGGNYICGDDDDEIEDDDDDDDDDDEEEDEEEDVDEDIELDVATALNQKHLLAQMMPGGGSGAALAANQAGLLFLNSKKRRRKLLASKNGSGHEDLDGEYDDDNDEVAAAAAAAVHGGSDDLNSRRHLLFSANVTKNAVMNMQFDDDDDEEEDEEEEEEEEVDLEDGEVINGSIDPAELDSEKLAYLMYKQQQQQILAAQLGGAGVFRMNNKAKTAAGKAASGGVYVDPSNKYLSDDMTTMLAGLIESGQTNLIDQYNQALTNQSAAAKLKHHMPYPPHFPLNAASHQYHVNHAQGVSNFSQAQLPTKPMSNIEYQKWLLNNEHQKLMMNSAKNAAMNFKELPNLVQHPVGVFNGNGHKQHFQPINIAPQQQQPPAESDAKASKMSEVERIKQELLGYQREIELMQKQRELAKLLKQQKQQEAAKSAAAALAATQPVEAASVASDAAAQPAPTTVADCTADTSRRALSPTPPYSSSNEIAPPPHARPIAHANIKSDEDVVVSDLADKLKNLSNQDTATSTTANPATATATNSDL